MKVKSYYDGSKHIEKKEYPKIISTIVIIIANSIIYFFTKADSLDNYISLISSILLTLLALAIFRGLIRIKNDSLIKKKD